MLGRLSLLANTVCTLLFPASLAIAQTTVTTMQMRPIASVNGKDVYKAYCAGCHGDDLKGNGPWAAGMKVRPPDLTTYAVRHGGQFNSGGVQDYINGRNRTPRTMSDLAASQHAKETGEGAESLPSMPAFEPIFGAHYPQDVNERRMRMTNLVAYIKSQQVKEAPAEAPK
jgi:hypothetical protein